MDETEGLVRGQKATDTVAPIRIPVGKGTLGRIMNVIGEPIGKRSPIKGGKLSSPPLLKSWRLVSRPSACSPPMPVVERSICSAVPVSVRPCW